MIYKIVIIFAIILAVVYLFFRINVSLAPTTPQSAENKVCFGNKCFVVELAKSIKEVEKGLMDRKELGRNSGMLFVFEKEGNYPFWMKNTLIPLDIIWISADKKIVFIKENAEPCKSLICPSINPGVKAKYVLEINGGLAKELQIKIGDEAVFNLVD